ncbi:hypothetical protein [Brevundimonas naejangsanensis]|uniref:hypothetical protein n=1 Tax=Brevundimonas naejangsanensis TaxID=588932 RepID=UPI0026F2692E|nr:hypothetical protein [Brevundimonas naejangsanensis]
MEGGVHQEEIDPGDPTSPEAYHDPCSNALSKLLWNADASVSNALIEFLNRAIQEGDGATLSKREFGANLIKVANDQVNLGVVGVGPQVQPGYTPTVAIPANGATYLNWMGDVHNHPSGDPIPSDDEWYMFQNRVADIIATHPERNAEMQYVAIYIVIGDPPNAKIYAYTRHSFPGQQGQEVNPDAQSCPL